MSTNTKNSSYRRRDAVLQLQAFVGRWRCQRPAFLLSGFSLFSSVAVAIAATVAIVAVTTTVTTSTIVVKKLARVSARAAAILIVAAHLLTSPSIEILILLNGAVSVGETA